MAEFTYHEMRGLREAFQRDGYAIVRNVLDADFVSELDRHIDWLIERHPELPPETLGHWLIADDAFWVRFVSDDRLLDVAQELVGPDIAFFAADYICKPPGKGRPIFWHQDANYWPLEPMEVITIWFAVTESNRHNGGVRMLPGSHCSGLHPHEAGTESDNVLRTHVGSESIDESRAIDIELQLGDISIHHPHLIHGSNRNTSDQWRRGGSIQYMPATTRITQQDWPCPFHFRGETVPGINDYKPFPKYIEGEHMPFRGCEEWA